jgi:hypothetical protein
MKEVDYTCWGERELIERIHALESKDTTYNGWANYPTWRVNLELVDGYDWDGVEYKSVQELAGFIESMVDDAITSYGERDTSDLAVAYASAWLDQVDWYEIAEHVAEDYPHTIA